MGFASFSFNDANLEQGALDLLEGMTPEGKNALFEVLLKNIVRGSVWGLIDGKYQDYLNDFEKQEVAQKSVDEFVGDFNDPTSMVYESFENLIEKVVSTNVTNEVRRLAKD